MTSSEPFERDGRIAVYVSIGNSDDKLTQRRWADFCTDIAAEFDIPAITILGEWFSLPDSPYQNACWCVGFQSAADAEAVKKRIAVQAHHTYGQESVAWAVAKTEFI